MLQIRILSRNARSPIYISRGKYFSHSTEKYGRIMDGGRKARRSLARSLGQGLFPELLARDFNNARATLFYFAAIVRRCLLSNIGSPFPFPRRKDLPYFQWMPRENGRTSLTSPVLLSSLRPFFPPSRALRLSIPED